MTAKEIYRIWAPVGCKWVDWVRPVPFVAMNEYSKTYDMMNPLVPEPDFLEDWRKDSALIVDLPGAESVAEGIALARAGFRPIPIFNGTIEQAGSRATVDNQSAGIALIWGAGELDGIELDKDAPPAFLLDTNRLQRFKMEDALFDNSWDIYPQDIPSADLFISRGIRNIIVVGRAASKLQPISKDLAKILYKFSQKKLQIWWTDGYEIPKKVRIRRPFLKEKE